ncbi:MAG: sulfotransferase [Alphaproteobacteria bacterium]|nr:MAG: sulfotransferase [Alphaproteobacteria bacterium]
MARLLASWQLNRWWERRLRDELAGHLRQDVVPALPALPAAYPELSRSRPAAAPHRPALFVTARFRSGSTFLWQLLDAVPGVAAYYEPLNPRRWHRADSSGAVHDPTHRGVRDYRRHYEGLDHLDRFFRDEWSSHRLVMDARSEDRDLERFIAGLVAAVAADQLPVLQFNRVDFRLPWLKSRFPQARILHLYRHPRENFLSAIDPQAVPPEATLEAFPAHDRFLLGEWAQDLALFFPVLQVEREAHPYLLFYMIWRLSHAAGLAHADLSIAYEDLCADPVVPVRAALELVGRDLPRKAADPLRALSLGPRRPRWPEYASDAWFAAIEAEGERRLARQFGADG